MRLRISMVMMMMMMMMLLCLFFLIPVTGNLLGSWRCLLLLSLAFHHENYPRIKEPKNVRHSRTFSSPATGLYQINANLCTVGFSDQIVISMVNHVLNIKIRGFRYIASLSSSSAISHILYVDILGATATNVLEI